MKIIYNNPEIKKAYPGSEVVLPLGYGPIPIDNKSTFFFDIDNCLYERSTKIHDLMQNSIHDYFKHSLSLSDEDASELHHRYYKDYGLAIEGLVRHHQIDALQYNSVVDDSLPLMNVLKPNPKLREMLIRLKECGKVDRLWLVTNAYKNHALRVISLLGIGDLFDGLTYCDYSKVPIICKPMVVYFHNALTVAGIDYNDKKAVKKQLFVDDSEINCKAAQNLGFGTVLHYVEMNEDYEDLKKKQDFERYYTGDNRIIIIRHISDIPSEKPELFSS